MAQQMNECLGLRIVSTKAVDRVVCRRLVRVKAMLHTLRGVYSVALTIAGCAAALCSLGQSDLPSTPASTAHSPAAVESAPTPKSHSTIGSTITWQSRNPTVRALPKEFAQLYASLSQFREAGGNILTKAIVVARGQSIEAALREQGVYAGDDMPVQVDVFVCGLNPNFCKVVNGRTAWAIRPNAEIVVPDIRLKPIIVHRTYTKSAKDTLAGIVRDRQGCETFDDACLRYLKNLNKRRPGEIDESYSGVLTVPTRAYRATITPNPPVTSDPLLLPGMSGLRKHAVPGLNASTLSSQAGVPDVVEGTRARIMKLIAYPSSGDGRFALPSSGLTHVTVLDNSLDTAHCMLRNVKLFENPGVQSSNQRPPCGGRADAQVARDHGTHVVGLIASMTDSDAGPGVNPRAIVNFVPINVDSLINRDYAAALSDTLIKLHDGEDSPDVVNMSFEYAIKGPAANDILWDAINSDDGNTLFVVAAGNGAKSLALGSTCDVRPACQRASHVITVAALTCDDKPALYKRGEEGSNFGSSAVHVAAPGNRIVSTIAMNRIGELSGTSQAAPLVAGVASLLYLKDGKLRPAQVKNRIIYTSDLFPSLYPLMLGGRLNATRALEFKQAHVKKKNQASELLTLRDANAWINFGDLENQNKLVQLRFGQVRRLRFETEFNHYVLYFNNDANKDTGELQRKFVALKSTKEILFAKGAAATEPTIGIRIDQIEDYTSALVK